MSLSAAAAVTRTKDGERAPQEEATLTSVQEAAEGGKDERELASSSAPLKACPAEELPRRSFHIPRKNKEKQALFQYLPPESREFEDIMKILSTSYLQSSSAGAFVYTKAQLVQNELLEKDFAEKRREMKQNGRTDSELLESYGFLLLESYKLQGVCKKGLLVRHARTTTLGDPAKGVYLSRYSDLLQINPFNVDAAGDIIIFKVLKGKVKTISMSRNILDPTPNFDCHVSTNAHKVTSCLSYRAFELTQQYFYEYKFDEIKERPRHVRPHAVVSFIYKGNAALSTHKPMPPLRSNSRNSECSEGLTRKSIYTVWTGQLLNQGKVLCHVAIRSFTQLFLPFKLPEQLEMEKAMKLAEVKWRIPIALLSWDTYVDTGKGSQNGLHGSLFEVVDVSKHNSISSLLLMLEKEKMVLVKPLDDQGFLFLLSSKQLTNSNGIERGWTQSLLALFLSQESRGEVKPSLGVAVAVEDLRPDARNPIIPHLKTFLPALHYALCTLRASHPADPGAEVEREARAYMIGCSNKTHQSFHLAEYKENCKVQKKVYSYSRMNHDVEGSLHSYFYNPKFYQLAVAVAKEIVDVVPPPVCDTSMLDVRASEIRLFSRDGARTRQPQPMNDPGKMKELLKLIHLRKRNVAEEEGERNLVGDCGDRKRKAEDEAVGLVKKYLRTEDNRRESGGEEGHYRDCLSAVMRCMRVYDTDLRLQEPQSTSVPSTQTMLTMLFDTLQQVMAQHSEASNSLHNSGENPELGDETLRTALELGLPVHCDIDLRNWPDVVGPDDLEEQTDGSLSSPDEFSPSNNNELQDDPDLAKVPWKLIPITGIKPCQYSSLNEGNPFDPRFMAVSSSTEHCASSERRGHVCMEVDLQVVNNGLNVILNKDCNLTDSIPTEEPKSMKTIPVTEPKRADIVLSTEPRRTGITSTTGPKQTDTFSPAEPQRTHTAPPVDPKRTDMDPQTEPQHTDMAPPGQLKQTHAAPPVESKRTETVPQTEPKRNPTIPQAKLKQNRTAPPAEPKRADTVLPAEPKRADTASPAKPEQADDIAFEEAKDIESIGKNHLKKAETVPSNNTTNTDELVSQGPSIVDTILNEEFSNFSTEIQKLLKGEQVEYHSEMSMTFPQDLQWQDEVVFSEYVSHYTHPVPVHSYISTLRDHMNQLINCPSDHWEKATVCIPPPSSVCDHASLSAHSPARSVSFPCTSLNCTADTTLPTSEPVHSPPQHAVTTDFYQPLLNCSPDLQSPVVDSSGHTPLNTNVPVPEPMSKSINSVISQIRPDMFNTLLEIMKDVQKNTVKFYVHSMEENSVCSEIKDYLIQLGNAECKPHVFLESKNSLDKLLIIIQNKDIAAHIHTIPLLLYLKKLSSVSFAGVDSLEDVKNHTYNELFVSGGFIVSDEFVLNPDFITQNRLQLLLTFLEEKNCANTHWCWKVHCKTHKKLKELARVNNEALGLLNLLSTYQRRHVVEFLPYHECDCGTRQAPDLECLIKLQAQNVHYRHIIFLTERHFEMFPHHSKNGIMIASISNIMDSLPGCTSSTASCLETLEPNPSCPLVMFTEKEKNAEKRMLDFTEGSSGTCNLNVPPYEREVELLVPPPPPHQTDPFQLPYVDQLTPELQPPSTEMPKEFTALKQAISFKDSHQLRRQCLGSELGVTLPQGEKLKSYQSFLHPTSTWPVQSPFGAEIYSSLTPASISAFLSHQAMPDSCYWTTRRSGSIEDSTQPKKTGWTSIGQGSHEEPSPSSWSFVMGAAIDSVDFQPSSTQQFVSEWEATFKARR
ncbi:protein TASOR-like isoform X1 [Scleropages formosus]|uniref:protein TASOR-like isoform X1 n=1 Tax=Scleropages formosus TaxID=113540 RepID=UPI0010FA9CBD|nr:protein TASOR isoform X1 [Scleropages formosus]